VSLYSIAAFEVGQRVQLHPATDLWMSGARYGSVTRVTKTYVHVKVDLIGKVVRCHPDHIGEILL